MKLDDSVLEFALYDVLADMQMVPEAAVKLDELRERWRSTALRHSDLAPAIEMLVQSGSLIGNVSIGGVAYWTLSEAGHLRSLEIMEVAPTTMGDQVARSVLKTIRDRVPAESLQPRSISVRRRSSVARERARMLLDERAG